MADFDFVQLVFSPQFVSSLLYCGLLLAVRTGATRWARTTRVIQESLKIKALSHIRSALIVAFLVGMLYIWGEQAQSLVIALFVFIYAFARAIQGLLACVGGTAVKIRSQAYAVGDRIHVGKTSGDVVDSNWLTTSLLESGASGRRVTFPNSELLKEPIYNESLVEGFSFETLEVALERSENWKMASQLLLDSAEQQMTPFIDAARRRLAEVEKAQGVELPSPDPKVAIDLSQMGQISLRVRLLVPTSMKERVRSELLSTFLEKFYPICSVNDLLEKKIAHES